MSKPDKIDTALLVGAGILFERLGVTKTLGDTTRTLFRAGLRKAAPIVVDELLHQAGTEILRADTELLEAIGEAMADDTPDPEDVGAAPPETPSADDWNGQGDSEDLGIRWDEVEGS